MVFDSHGVYCMTCGNDRTIRLWNPQKLLPIKMYSGNLTAYTGPHNHEVNCVAISSNNSKFVSGGAESNVFIWDVIDGSVVNKFMGHTGNFLSFIYVLFSEIIKYFNCKFI